MEKHSSPFGRYWTSDMQLHSDHFCEANAHGSLRFGRMNAWLPQSGRSLQGANSDAFLHHNRFDCHGWNMHSIGQISRECLDRLDRLEIENRQLRQQCESLEAQIHPLIKALHHNRGVNPPVNLVQPIENGKYGPCNQMDGHLRQLINILVHTNLAQNNIREDCRYLKNRVTCLEEANARLYGLLKELCTTSNTTTQEAVQTDYQLDNDTNFIHNDAALVNETPSEKEEKEQEQVPENLSSSEPEHVRKDYPWPVINNTNLMRTSSTPLLSTQIDECPMTLNYPGSTWRLKFTAENDASPHSITPTSELRDSEEPKCSRDERHVKWFYKFPSRDLSARRSSVPLTSVVDLVPHAWLQMTSLPTAGIVKRQPVGTRSHVILGSRFLPLDVNKQPSKKSAMLTRQVSAPERKEPPYASPLNPIEEVDSNTQSFYDLQSSDSAPLKESNNDRSRDSSIEDLVPDHTELEHTKAILCRDLKFRYLHPLRLMAEFLTLVSENPGSGRLKHSMDLESSLYEQEKLHKCRDAQRNLRCSVFSDTELLTGKFNITSRDDSAIESGEDDDMLSSSEDRMRAKGSLGSNAPLMEPAELEADVQQLEFSSIEITEEPDSVYTPTNEDSEARDRENPSKELVDIARDTVAEEITSNFPTIIPKSEASNPIEHSAPVFNSSPLASGRCQRPNVPPPVVIHRKRFGVFGSNETMISNNLATVKSTRSLRARSIDISTNQPSPTGHSTPEQQSSDTDSALFTQALDPMSADLSSPKPSPDFPAKRCSKSPSRDSINAQVIPERHDNNATLTRCKVITKNGTGITASISQSTTSLKDRNCPDSTTSNLPVSRPATSPRTRRTSGISAQIRTTTCKNRVTNSREMDCTPGTQLPVPSRSFPSSPDCNGPMRKYKTHLSQSIVKVSKPDKSVSIGRAEIIPLNDSPRTRSTSDHVSPDFIFRGANRKASDSIYLSKASLNPPPIPPRTTSRNVASQQTCSMSSNAQFGNTGSSDCGSYIISYSPNYHGQDINPPIFQDTRTPYSNLPQNNRSPRSSNHVTKLNTQGQHAGEYYTDPFVVLNRPSQTQSPYTSRLPNHHQTQVPYSSPEGAKYLVSRRTTPKTVRDAKARYSTETKRSAYQEGGYSPYSSLSSPNNRSPYSPINRGRKHSTAREQAI